MGLLGGDCPMSTLIFYTITGNLKKNTPQFLLNFSGYKQSRKLGHISNYGDIHRYVLSTISFLCDNRELRYMQNNTEQQNIEMVKYR